MALVQSGIRRRVVWRSDTDAWKNRLSTSSMASSTMKAESAASSKTRLHGVTPEDRDLNAFSDNYVDISHVPEHVPQHNLQSPNVSSQLRGNCQY